MMRFVSLFFAVALLALLVACPMSVPGGNDNSANANGSANDNGSSNENVNGGANTNQAGENGNTNGDAQNGNANGTSGGGERACDDGSISLRAALLSGGSESGSMSYREFTAGCREFVLAVQGFAAGSHDVMVAGGSVGQITVAEDGTGLLFYDSTSGSFPANFPDIQLDDAGDVGGIAVGMFEKSCPAVAEVCIAGGGPARPPETCTEDASKWIQTQIVFNSRQMSDSVCKNVADMLETRLARLSFVNTHPTRTVAIAVIMSEQSDRQNFSPAPCVRAIEQGGFQSLQQCIDSIAEGCESPPSLFLTPGETSLEWLYICRREALYPGSGICADKVLETVTTRILAQAVFCDDFNTAMTAFCDIVHPALLTTGMPATSLDLGAIQRDDCPDGG